MMANPVMVGGPGRFDTRLMEVCSGRLVAKGGAEGYMLMGVMPGTLGGGSPGIGIAFKVSDGDHSLHRANGESFNRVRPAVALEILKQMDCIQPQELEALSDEFGPHKTLTNWRKLVVGESRPAFTLQRAEPAS